LLINFSSESESDLQALDADNEIPSFTNTSKTTIDSTIEKKGSKSSQNSSKSVRGSSRVLPRQVSAEAILINASKSSQSDTTVWSNTEGIMIHNYYFFFDVRNI